MTSKSLPQLTSELIQGFWARVDVKPNKNECWEWKAYCNENGYGRLYIKGLYFYSHRTAYFLGKGIDPIEWKVLHECDNPPCCNPHHLKLGTHGDNVRDMIAKGRDKKAKGEDAPNVKLKEWQVKEIRQKYEAGGISMEKLARQYDIYPSGVWMIVRRKIWAHVE